MNSAVEDLLVDVLHADAASAPAAASLLDAVHGRARRRARRRTGLISSFAFLGLVAGGVAASRPDGRDEVLPRPLPAAAPADGPLEEGGLPALTFPVTPGWLPEGVSRTPRVSVGDSGESASYDDAARPQYVGIDIWAGTKDMTFTGDGVIRRMTTHQGRPATIATLADSVSLGWQPAPGRWRTVVGGNAWGDEAVVRRVAESLAEQPFDVVLPLRLDLVPSGHELASWSTTGTAVFVRAGEAVKWRTTGQASSAVSIAARRTGSDGIGEGERVTVSGRLGWLRRGETGGWHLVVQTTDAVNLIFDTPAWDRADVLRLAEATRYTGGLPPPEG